MHATLRMASVLAAMVLGALPTHAQNFEMGMKFGAGTVISSPGDQRSRATVGYALTGSYRLAEGRALTFEARYRELRADFYEATQFSAQIVPTTSVDVRRDRAESVGLAVGYRSAITPNLSWQAGLSMDHTSATQEVTGQITLPAAPGGTTPRIEGLSVNPGEKGFKPGAYAGLQYNISKSFFVESNLVYYAFKQPKYTPASYTANYVPVTDSKNTTKVILEFSAGFRF